MLVLTRSESETICIGDSITIVVVAVKGKKVRIGVEAPRSIRVDRKEVREQLPSWGSSESPPAGEPPVLAVALRQ